MSGAAASGRIHRLIYRSVCAIPGTAAEVAAEVEAILATSRRRNARAGLTGVLLHDGPSFVQVLEGEAAALEEAFDRISMDLRHTGFELLQFIEAPERHFAGWAMGYAGTAEALRVAAEERDLALALERDAEGALRALAAVLRAVAPATPSA